MSATPPQTTQITIEIDPAKLRSYADSHLAMLWHVAQANPADGFKSDEPGDLAEKVGREIIRRWLTKTEPEMYRHQGRHYHWHQLCRFAKWDGTDWIPRGTDDATTGGGVR